MAAHPSCLPSEFLFRAWGRRSRSLVVRLVRSTQTPPKADEFLAACRAYRAGWLRQGLRPLGPQDHAVVEEIGAATYGGHDYVATVFPEWIRRQGRDTWTVAVEGDGQLVGFEVLSLYDQGRTGWLGSGARPGGALDALMWGNRRSGTGPRLGC